MKYPARLVDAYGSIAAFAAAASDHPFAPRVLTEVTARQWKARDTVPWPWRACIGAMIQSVPEKRVLQSGHAADAEGRKPERATVGGDSADA